MAQLRFATRTLVPSHLCITAPSSLAIMTLLHRALLESLSDPLVASFRAAHQCTCGLPRDPSIPACTAEPASVPIKEHFSTEPLHVNNPELLAHVVHPKIPQDLDKKSNNPFRNRGAPPPDSRIRQGEMAFEYDNSAQIAQGVLSQGIVDDRSNWGDQSEQNEQIARTISTSAPSEQQQAHALLTQMANSPDGVRDLLMKEMWKKEDF